MVCLNGDRRAMDISTSLIAAAALLMLPLIGLAGLGILFIKSLTTYNHPILPKGSPGLAQRSQLFKGQYPLPFI